MRTWEGIRRDTAATGAGAQEATNVRLYFEGDMRRRLARERLDAFGVRLGLISYGAPNGGRYAVRVTADGDLMVDSV